MLAVFPGWRWSKLADAHAQGEPDLDLGLMEPILARHAGKAQSMGRGGGQSALLPLLQQTQAIYGYLPRPAMELISKALRVPLARVYGVVTFYAQFYLTPRPRHLIRCCQGTACHVKGSKQVLRALQDELGVAEGGATQDMRFALETVNCLGTCFLAPVMMVDDRYFGDLAPSRVGRILREFS